MLLDEAGAVLVEGALGTLDVDIFYNEYNDLEGAPDNQILIMPYAVDAKPPRTMGPKGTPPSADVERFTIECRNADRQAAWTKAKNVRAFLDWYDGTPLSNAWFNVTIAGTLTELDRDSNGRFRVAGSYEVWKLRS